MIRLLPTPVRIGSLGPTGPKWVGSSSARAGTLTAVHVDLYSVDLESPLAKHAFHVVRTFEDGEWTGVLAARLRDPAKAAKSEQD